MYALIICGGKGERLKPLTNTLSKVMIEIAGKPIIEHQIEGFKRAGVKNVVFLSGYKAKSIEDYFGDGSNFGFNAYYSTEDPAKPLGRGGALRQGFAYVPKTEKVVFASNGDIITTQNFAQLLDYHHARNAVATDMLVNHPSQFGVVKLSDNGAICKFAEKKPLENVWINAGIYILNREIETSLPIIGDHEDSTFPDLANAGNFFGFLSTEKWIAVDNHKDINTATEILLNNQ